MKKLLLEIIETIKKLAKEITKAAKGVAS